MNRSGTHRVVGGDQLQLVTTSRNASQVFARAIVTYDDGEDSKFETLQTPNSDRTTATTILGRVDRPGFVTRCIVGVVSGTVKRGECFAELAVLDSASRNADMLAAGYVGNNKNLPLDFVEQPTDGKGFLVWTQEGNDISGNVVTTVALGVANARRIARQILVLFVSNGVATRNIFLTLRDMADATGPTAFGIDQDSWVSPVLTLTDTEDGLIHVAEHGFLSLNDNGTLTYADNSSAPNPFPVEVEDGETGDLLLTATNGLAADDYDIWIQYEEWIEI